MSRVYVFTDYGEAVLVGQPAPGMGGFPLDQAGDALAVVETGHSAGKTIIQP